MKLYNRETSYYTIITIPKCLVSKYGKKQIWRSLNTKDYKLAKLRAELETMSIRRKLLNDLNKQKEKTSKALDFAQILDDDDDDFFEDDIDIKDTVDFSHYICRYCGKQALKPHGGKCPYSPHPNKCHEFIKM